MQRFINDPNDIVEETIQGFVKVHHNLVHISPDNPRVVVSKHAGEQGRVGIVSGGIWA